MCKLQSLLSSSHSRLLLPSHDDDFNIDGRSFEIRVGGAEPSSACLWAMVDDFLEVDACEHPALYNMSCAGAKSSNTILKGAIQVCILVFISCYFNCSSSFVCTFVAPKILELAEMESLLGESSAQVDAVEAKIVSCVRKALKFNTSMVGGESAHNKQALLAVIKYLHREGCDAGLCVTARKPGNAAGISPTGGHRYIDVILEEEPVLGTPQLVGEKLAEKLIVDVGFPMHFEIARPLPAYQKLMGLLPSTFIGKSALLQKVVRIMSQAAKASLESQGMSIPPWRSFSFLLAKWLSPSCSRITSVDKAKHIVLNTSSTNHVKPRVLAALDYNTDLANLADSHANDDSCKGGPKLFFLKEEDVPKAWCPPPPTNQIPINYDNDDTSSSYTPKRQQASVVSALTLAFAETQVTHMCAAGA